MLSNRKTSVIFIIALIALWLASARVFYIPPAERARPQPEVAIPDFKAFKTAKARKAAFFEYLQPLIAARNSKVLAERTELQTISQKPLSALTRKEKRTLKQLAERYKLPTEDEMWLTPEAVNELLKRIDIIPPSLALAQAASESGWGRSRFARMGHNYFGEWCFTQGCGFVPKNRPAGAVHEVRRFHHPRESVAAYFYNLNTGDAYQDLRDIRAQLQANNEAITGLKLAPGLLNYSERRGDYVHDIQVIIRSNKLSRFDTDSTLEQQ